MRFFLRIVSVKLVFIKQVLLRNYKIKLKKISFFCIICLA